MKLKHIVSVMLLFVVSVASAQIDRTSAPEPAPAPKINIAEPYTFELKNGLKVYVVENHKLPRVAFRLLLDREPVLEEDKVGYVGMAGDLLRSGTTTRTKAELDKDIDFIGASLSTSSVGIYASSLTKHQDKLVELMTDVLFNPSFPEEELEKMKKQALSGLAASKDDPSAIASNVSGALVFGKDHPYGEFTTEASIENITLEDCKAYYNTYFKPNIAHLAIVGDIKPKDAKKLVKKAFGEWESGDVPAPTYEMPAQPEETYVALVDREASVQSVVEVTYPVELKPGASDVIKARVLNQILGGGFSSRLMQNLREDKAFTYGARSSLSSDKLVGYFSASANVRNEVTDSAVYEFMYELDKIVKEGVTQDELDAAKASIAGSFARSLESPQTVASFAINTAIYNLPADYYNNYLKSLESVTVADVKAMAQKYIKPNNAHILVVGKGSDVAKGLKQFGEVKYFDRQGEEYDPKDNAKVPEGVTAETVIADYIKAIGGEEKLKSIENMSLTYEASIQGQTIRIVSKKNNKASLRDTQVMGMSMSKQIYDGTNIKASARGQEMPIPEDAKKDLPVDAKIFPELYYNELGVETTLKGMGEADGKSAYKVEVVMPSGSSSIEYFDTETGLKLKSETTQETPQGAMTVSTGIGSYKEVEGVKIPAELNINQGMPFKAELKEAKVNTDLPADTFEIK
jgi:zinc protease